MRAEVIGDTRPLTPVQGFEGHVGRPNASPIRYEAAICDDNVRVFADAEGKRRRRQHR